MRLASYVALAAAIGLLTAAVPAEAQTGATQKKRTQIIVKKRSYLDAGTTVKPGSMNYHDYAFGPAMRAPTYGPPGSENMLGGDRWPLLRWWEY
jgi:hypothetical protein